MNSFSRFAICALLTLSYAITGLAQTPEEIIEKHLAAVGGRTALTKLTSRVITGSLVMNSPVGDLQGTVEVYSKSPNKSRTLVKLDVPGIGQIVDDQRFDGAAGYVTNSFTGNREITGEALAAMRNGTFPSPLLNYKENGATLTLAGEEKVGAKDAYVIRATPKVGPTVRLFFDKENFMLVKTVTTINVPELGGAVDQVVEYSDFKDVEGIKTPYTTKTANPAQTGVSTVKDVKYNVPIDDSSFLKPAGQ